MSRPKKKEHDANSILMSAVLQAVSLYEDGMSLSDISREMKMDGNEMSPQKVRKLLITGQCYGLCVYESPKAEAVLALYDEDYSIEDIMVRLGLCRASVYSYIPYKRLPYTGAGSAGASAAAERIRLYRKREEAVAKLQKDVTEENLWEAIIAFQNYPFRTVSGLPFTYTLKIGRSGAYTKELLIDRRENSKSLSWSSVVLAFRMALEQWGRILVRPKDLGDIRGISYIYPLFWRFGLITVPEKAASKMEISQNPAIAGQRNHQQGRLQ